MARIPTPTNLTRSAGIEKKSNSDNSDNGHGLVTRRPDNSNIALFILCLAILVVAFVDGYFTGYFNGQMSMLPPGAEKICTVLGWVKP